MVRSHSKQLEYVYEGSVFLMDPDLGGLPEWETHRMGNKEGEMHAGRRNPKGTPKYHSRENLQWKAGFHGGAGRNEDQCTDSKVRCRQVFIHRAVVWASSEKFWFYLRPVAAVPHLSLPMTFLPQVFTSHFSYHAGLDTAQDRALDSAGQHTGRAEQLICPHSPQYGAVEVVRR